MTTKQANKYRMYLTTQGFLNEAFEIAMLLPEYAGFKAELDESLEASGEIIRKQELDRSGVTEMKQDKRNVAIGKGLSVSRKLVAFGIVKHNTELAEDARLPDLARCSDTVLNAKLCGIYDLGVKYKPDAGAFGINDALLDATQTAMNEYFDYITRPAVNRAERKALTSALKEQFKKTDGILKVIDALVDTAAEEHRTFWDLYQQARKIEHLGHRYLSLMVQVNDAGNGLGLKGVMLEIEQVDGEGGREVAEPIKLKKKSSTKGGAWVKRLDSGTYLLRARKLGFEEQELKFYMTKGEMTRVAVRMAGR